ncbi:MAG TPA: hypothetical protein VFG39_03775 [Balneolaceae bacterium]|nr:hypothetical protein [Balneolaceae bacterium]
MLPRIRDRGGLLTEALGVGEGGSEKAAVLRQSLHLGEVSNVREYNSLTTRVGHRRSMAMPQAQMCYDENQL